jgi:hypothetical protein
VACNKVNLKRIATHWPDMLRVAGSLITNQVRAYDLLRMFGREGHPTPLGAAFAEYGRIDKTMHLLAVVDPVDDTYRRLMNRQLTVQESRHRLARAICHGGRGQIRQAYREGQEDQNVTCSPGEGDRYRESSDRDGRRTRRTLVARSSPSRSRIPVSPVRGHTGRPRPDESLGGLQRGRRRCLRYVPARCSPTKARRPIRPVARSPAPSDVTWPGTCPPAAATPGGAGVARRRSRRRAGRPARGLRRGPVPNEITSWTALWADAAVWANGADPADVSVGVRASDGRERGM